MKELKEINNILRTYDTEDYFVTRINENTPKTAKDYRWLFWQLCGACSFLAIIRADKSDIKTINDMLLIIKKWFDDNNIPDNERDINFDILGK